MIVSLGKRRMGPVQGSERRYAAKGPLRVPVGNALRGVPNEPDDVSGSIQSSRLVLRLRLVFYVALSLRERIAEESHAAARQAAAILSRSERAT